MDWRPVIGIGLGVIGVWVLLVVRPRDARLGDLLRLIPDLLRLVRNLLGDRGVPFGARVALVLLLAWLISPIDLIPEFIPVLGPLDDVVVAVLVLRYVRRRVGLDELQRRWPRALPLLERAVNLCQDTDIPVFFPRTAAALGAAYALRGLDRDWLADDPQAQHGVAQHQHHERQLAQQRAVWPMDERLAVGKEDCGHVPSHDCRHAQVPHEADGQPAELGLHREVVEQVRQPDQVLEHRRQVVVAPSLAAGSVIVPRAKPRLASLAEQDHADPQRR